MDFTYVPYALFSSFFIRSSQTSLLLDLQSFSIENNKQLTNGQKANGEVNPIKNNSGKTGNAPVQKNDNKNKHWKSS